MPVESVAAFKPRTASARAKQRKGVAGPINWPMLIVTLAVGAALWFCPVPAGLEEKAWHMFAIFAATIVGLIIKPAPMGAVAIMAITASVLTGTVGLKDSLSGFSNTTIWLIVIAFFISRGFIKTGLGNRVAYLFVERFGKKTLGLAYSLIATDLVLSPAMPSNTARAGGIVWPIVQSLSHTFGSRADDGTQNKIGSFLHLCAFQGDMITSAMFVTAMAANRLPSSLPPTPPASKSPGSAGASPPSCRAWSRSSWCRWCCTSSTRPRSRKPPTRPWSPVRSFPRWARSPAPRRR